MSRRTVMVAASAAVAVAVVFAIVSGGSRASSNRISQGPLADHGSTGVILNAIPLNVGVPVSIGLDVPVYRGTQVIRIDGIHPVRTTEGIRILGYRWLRPSENNGGLEAGPGFPPKPWIVHPIPGVRLHHGSPSGEIIVGIESTRVGFQNVLGFIVAYHVGQDHYRALIPHAVTICAPLAGGESCDQRPNSRYVSAAALADELLKLSRQPGYE